MARPLRPFMRFDTSTFQPTEDMLLQPIPIGGFRGEDKTSPLPSMVQGTMRLVRDMNLRYGAYRSRDGTSAIGAVSGSNLLYACNVHLVDGSTYTVRFRTDGVDVLQAGVWIAATGDAFSGLEAWPFAITGWNDRILFTAGVGRMYELTFSPAFVVNQIDESPAGIIHLATFNGRVVASLFGTTVQWTVKFDHTDWSGQGSGFEDLQSAAGGQPDQQTAVIPISDLLAYCVRTESIWQMGDTGDPDAPFSFNRAYTHVGSRLPMTVMPTQRGIVCVGSSGQVWNIAPEGVEDIAPLVVNDFTFSDPRLEDLMAASYDIRFDEYRVAIPSASASSSKVMRYSFVNKAWTEDVYPFPIKSISYIRTITGMSTDELIGTDDSLVGTTDALGNPVKSEGVCYSMRGATSRFVVKDDPTLTNDPLKDVNFDGTRIAAGFRSESGDIKITDPIKRQEFAEILCWYESDIAITLNFEYSQDGGTTWNAIGSVIAPATNGRPEPISIQQTFDLPHVQFSVWTAVAPNARIISYHAMMREGARITDAR